MERTPDYMQLYWLEETRKAEHMIKRAEIAMRLIEERRSGQLPLLSLLDIMSSDNNQNQKEPQCNPP